MRYLLLLLPLSLCALDLHYNPWFGRDKEFEVGPYYTFRHYDRLDCEGDGNTSDYANIIGASFNFTWAPDWFFYSQVDLADTRHLNFNLNQWLLFVNTKWCDDIVGDCVSFTTGLQFAINTNHSLRQEILYHTGEWEFELHAAVGKEYAIFENWIFRGFLDLAVGIADRGTPWGKGLLAFEYNMYDCHYFALLARSWIGFGDQTLRCDQPFKGYGSLAHQNLDLGLAYQWSACEWGLFGIEGYIGVASKNYPKIPLEFTLFWRYNFGI